MTRTLHRLLIGTASAALLAGRRTCSPSAPGLCRAGGRRANRKRAPLNAWFDRIEQEDLARSPLTKAYRGIIDEDYGRLKRCQRCASRSGDVRAGQARLALHARKISISRRLDASAQLSWRLFEYRQEQAAMNQPFFRRHGYVFNQMGGPHSQVPVVMTTIHRINSARTAEQWIERAGGVPDLMARPSPPPPPPPTIAEPRRRFEMGVAPAASGSMTM